MTNDNNLTEHHKLKQLLTNLTNNIYTDEEIDYIIINRLLEYDI